jgi:hypothetical protein
MTTLREAAQQALEVMLTTQALNSPSLQIPEAITALRAALVQQEPWTPAKLGDALVWWVDASALAQQEQKPVAWMRNDGLKAMPADEKTAWAEADLYHLISDYTIPLYTHPPRRETEQEQAMRDLLTTGTGVLLGGERIDPASMYMRQEQEPVAWTDRELELIDGMIEVQLHHAAQCDGIANRPMAERQKGWDMERVALLHKIKSISPRREWRSLTNEEIYPLYNEPRSDAEILEFARAVEAALKEKNHE